jgi:2-amino-4-hydroxy-6-hydroxymethyldihydropteridine diphosphokinase
LSKGKKTFVLLSLGANLGSKRESIENAVEYLKSGGIISEAKISSYYNTEPVGFKEQPDFLNIAVSGYTVLPLNDLIEACKSIEYYIGRHKRQLWHEREIDVDILLYGDRTVENPNITVPHPKMHQRRFVLLPASEIASEAIHPKLKRTVNQLLKDCKDYSEVRISC